MPPPKRSILVPNVQRAADSPRADRTAAPHPRCHEPATVFHLQASKFGGQKSCEFCPRRL